MRRHDPISPGHCSTQISLVAVLTDAASSQAGMLIVCVVLRVSWVEIEIEQANVRFGKKRYIDHFVANGNVVCYDRMRSLRMEPRGFVRT